MNISRCLQAISNLKKVLAAKPHPFSKDEPVFPIRLVYTGDKEVISRQRARIQEMTATNPPVQEKALEDFEDELVALVSSGKKYISLDEARKDVSDFCEVYSVFKPSQFYIADTQNEKFPIDPYQEAQQVIPGVTKPQQWTIPGVDVELPSPEKE